VAKSTPYCARCSELIAAIRRLSSTTMHPRTPSATPSINTCGFMVNEPSPHTATSGRPSSCTARASNALDAKPM